MHCDMIDRRNERMKHRVIGLALTVSMLCALAVPVSAADSGAVQTVQALGIIVGDGNGNMNLSAGVTRAEFTKMLVAASSYKDSISSDGTGYSLFKDVKSNHWASEYIRVAVESGWVVGYTDGSFRPDQPVRLEEACSAMLRVLGYDASMLAGSFPGAQLNKAAALGLRDQVQCKQGENLTRQDCAELFYNMLTAKTAAGQTYAVTLGYPLVNGQVDYTAVLKDSLQGPFVASGTGTKLPFTPGTVYRNGEKTDTVTLNPYDVYYYNQGTGTAWIYTDRVSGKVTALSPSPTAPTSVTVSGVTYAIGSPDAQYQLSALGGGKVGSMVTLLLGMNGDVVQVLTGSAVDSTYYGVVLSSSWSAAGENAAVQTQVQVICTDGVTRTFSVEKDVSYEAGRLVSVSVSDNGTTVKGLGAKSTEGTVNAAGTKLGQLQFADGVQILDTDDGAAVAVEPSRLAGRRLSGSQVRYYALDENGNISHLILDDVTGDTWQYGYLLSVETSGREDLFYRTYAYTYAVDGVIKTYLSSGTSFPVQTGAVAIRFDGAGGIKAMRSIQSGKLTSLSGTAATIGNQKYSLADGVQVYLRQNGAVYLTSLSNINDVDYRLTGWYDPSGNQIRVITAEPK